MVVVVSDRSHRNAIRNFEGVASFFYKGRKYEIMKRYASDCNVLDITRLDDPVLELSWHNANKMLHQLQIKNVFPHVSGEDFMWTALYAALEHVGYKGFKRDGEDDEYDYRLLIAMNLFPEEVEV